MSVGTLKHTYHGKHVGSDDNLVELVLTCHHVGSRYWTQGQRAYEVGSVAHWAMSLAPYRHFEDSSALIYFIFLGINESRYLLAFLQMEPPESKLLSWCVFTSKTHQSNLCWLLTTCAGWHRIERMELSTLDEQNSGSRSCYAGPASPFNSVDSRGK